MGCADRSFCACGFPRRSVVIGLPWLLCMAAAIIVAAPRPAEAQEPAVLLVTQVPAPARQAPARQAPARPAPARRSPLALLEAVGSRIAQLLPDGTERVLTNEFHSACDPAVSFDAQRILFAGKRRAEDNWNIFELELATQQVRQVTQDTGNCRQPGYQATLYTIVSAEPWYQLTFLSDAAGQVNEAGTGCATSLYSCKLDGSEVRRLTYNLSDDVDPFLMRDGRLVYAGWQRSTLARGTDGLVSLFGVNIDGTDQALFAEQRGLPVKRMPCITDRGQVVFVEYDFAAAEPGNLLAGQLGGVSFRRPLHSYRAITTAEEDFLYRDPQPWGTEQVVVARRHRAAGGSLFEICAFHPRTKQATVLHRDPRHHLVQPVALLPSPEPDGRSSVVDEGDPHGKLYCLNVAWDDVDDTALPPGTVRRIRFLEGVGVSADQAAALRLPTALTPCPGATRNGLPPLAQRRVLGEIDLQSDDSFQVAVPANTPIQIQTLDERGVALRTCGWIWAKNREPRGCIGCHEDGELTPENRLVEALALPAVQLTLPPQRRRTVDFRRDLQPIIDQKCLVCHAGDGAPPRLDGPAPREPGLAEFNAAYVALLAKSPGSSSATPRGKYVDPGQARSSPLIWHLCGENLSRPWDGDRIQGVAHPLETRAGVVPLTDLERRRFVEWVDLGALWDGIPDD